MKRFTITITGHCADTVSDVLIDEMAAAAEAQVIEPDLFVTEDVLTLTAIERESDLPGVVPEFEMSRSCFIDFPTAEAAEHAIAVLHEMSVIVDPLVEHRVNNTMHHVADDGEPERWSVYFTLNCDSGSPEEAAFIEAATKLGGTYSGT